jgi:deoxyribodipyrimidine photo-lyase
MMFEASRAKALNQLNNFIDTGLADNTQLRKFDFGPEKRNNISCLSPYITHGIINEQEVIQKALSKFSFSNIVNFIKEVFWRTYWKGWLELRPYVWADYLSELNQIKN